MAGNIKTKLNRGFTIVELLIVIVVIGILAALVLNSFSEAQKKARDSKRLSDVVAIEKALRTYAINQGQLPVATANPGVGGWEISTDVAGSFMEYLSTAGLLRDVPLDPTNSPQRHYRYHLYPAGSYSCDASRGRIAVIQVLDMESSGRPHPQSPGFQCPGRDWGAEADWVTGFYEND